MKISVISIVSLVALCISTISFGQVAFEPDQAKRPNQRINIGESSLAFPFPSWIPDDLKPKQAMELLETELLPHDNGLFYLQLPKGQTQETTDRALIAGLQVSALLYEVGKRYPLNVQLDHFAERLIDDEKATCSPEHFKEYTQLLAPLERGAMFFFACASGLEGVKEGYGADNGTVAVGRVIWRDDVAFYVMNQWWGDSFELDDESSWPVSIRKRLEFAQLLNTQVEAKIVINPDWDPFSGDQDTPFLK